jgi:prophage antirepressor-like protein
MQIKNLTYSGAKVRAIDVDGEMWWPVVDVCRAIGYSNSRKAIELIDKEDVTKRYVNHPEVKRSAVWTCNESGLYQLLLRSNVPGAKPFQRWVTREVLPAIRQTGHYSVSVPTAPATTETPPWAEQLMGMLGQNVVELKQEQARLVSSVGELEAKVEAIVENGPVDAQRVAQEMYSLQARDRKIQKAKQNALKKAIYALAGQIAASVNTAPGTGQKVSSVKIIIAANKRIKGAVTARRGVIDWGREFYEDSDFDLAYSVLDVIAQEYRLPERPKPISFLDFARV